MPGEPSEQFNQDREPDAKIVPDEIKLSKGRNTQIIKPEEMQAEMEIPYSAEGRSEVREEDLSPEIIEKIMGKVQDIDEYGTAYHVMTSAEDLPGFSRDRDERPWKERLEDILKHGLLGTVHERTGTVSKVNSEKWVRGVKKEKRGEVMFNIIGREFHESDLSEREREDERKAGKTWIETGTFMWQDSNKIAIIFDVSKFKEVEPRKGEDFKLPKPKTFHVDSKKTKMNERGELMAQSDYGFSLYPRVAPKLFKGLVFKATRKYSEKEREKYLKTWGDTPNHRYALEMAQVEEDDPQKLEERAEEIVLLMKKVYENKPDILIPVYDVRGNLYWPEKLSHTEIQKLKSKPIDTADNLKQEKKERYSRTVLEIGSGSLKTPWLEDRNLNDYATAHIICTDIQHKTIKDAAKETDKKLKELGNKFIGKFDYMAADGKHLPFDENSMDEIYLANVLGDPKTAEKQKIISEATRVLAINGDLIIVEWATPEYAIGVRSSDIHKETVWKNALGSFVDQLKKMGLKVKTIESPDYRSDLSMRGVMEPEKLKEIFNKREEYLSNFPYTKKFIGGLGIPEVAEAHPFILVLKK